MNSVPSTVRPLAPRRILAGAAAAGLIVLGLGVPMLYGWWYADRVLPGVRVVGVDVGGLTAEEAAARLRSALPGAFGERVTLRDADTDRSWDYPPSELGLASDPAEAVVLALGAGREADGGVGWAALRLRWRPTDVAPEGVPFDADLAGRALEALAPQANVAPANAGVRREGDRLVSVPSTLGRTLDVGGSLAALADFARRPVADTLDLVMSGTSARVFDTEGVVEAYRIISSGPITMTWREGRAYTVPVGTLRQWFRVEDVTSPEADRVPSIIVDRDAIRRHIAPWSKDIDHGPADARYTVDLSTGRAAPRDPGRPGVVFDLDASVEAVIAAAYSEQRVGEIAASVTPATVRDDLAAALNATVREVRKVSTSFQGSPPGRVANLLVLADRFNGVTLAAGQEFSFNRYVGPLTAEAGFDVPWLSGPNGATDLWDIGGCVAQVATTAFRAAFWAGLPITERHAPRTRLGWLEPPVGLDAAAWPGERDLRFVNDTEGYLLIQSTLDVASGALVWTLYAVPDERRVSLTGPTVTEVTPAGEAVTRRDPRLAAGARQQVAWAREGARVTAGRTVARGGAPAAADTFASVYAPAGDVVLVGTGGG